MPKRNTYHSRGDFFWAKQEENETPEEHWKKLITLEKNCEFKDIKQKNLFISKFITSITDKKLREKLIREKTLNLETTVELITQNSYDRRHKQSTIPAALAKDKEIKEEPIQKIQPKFKTDKYGDRTTQKKNNCGFCGQQNWNPQHTCPAKNAKCNNCQKMGHFARVCRSKQNRNDQRRINYLEETSSEEEESEPEEIRQITQINKILPDNNDHYGVEMIINGKKQKFIIDTGSPVTIMPYDQKLHKTKEIKPMKERYQDVNKNEIKFMGKTWVTAEYNWISTKLPMLITKSNDITPLLGVNWLKQLLITINKISLDNEAKQSESVYKKYHKLFDTNHTIKDAEVKIQIKPGCYPIQQKARPIPYHLQEDVKNELNRLIESGHLERLETIEEDCFVSPVVIIPVQEFRGRPIKEIAVRYVRINRVIENKAIRNKKQEDNVRAAELDFMLDLETLIKETAADLDLIELQCCIEDNNLSQAPEAYKPIIKNLTHRWGITMFDDRIIVPKSLRYAALNALPFGHPGINKMCGDAAKFWWPNMRTDIEKKAKTCSACMKAGKNLKCQIPSTEKTKIEPPENPGEEIQMDFTGNLNSKHFEHSPFILIAVDSNSRWPVAKICKNTNHESVITFIPKGIYQYLRRSEIN